MPNSWFKTAEDFQQAMQVQVQCNATPNANAHLTMTKDPFMAAAVAFCTENPGRKTTECIIIIIVWW